MGKLKDSLTKLKQTMSTGGASETSSVKSKTSSGSLKSTASSDKKKTKNPRSDIPEERQTLSKKEKRKLAKQQELANGEESGDEEEGDSTFDTAALDDSDQSEEEEEEIENSLIDDEAEEEDDDDEDEEDESEDDSEEDDVALSDVELDEDADVVPHQKTTVNNKKALEQAYDSISLGVDKLPFYEHMTITSTEPLVLKDIYDDIERELAFYKQGLATANDARKKLKKEKIPFSRPVDYFAEMVKSDEHMEKLKQKMIEEKTAEKASQEAKRQRQLKKFGKQVQHSKLQERQKEKRETLDKIKSLKRKRGNNELTNEDFDIALEDAAGDSKSKNRPAVKGEKRKAKDAKYGSGGKKRYKKANDAKSSGDISEFSHKKMKSGGKTKQSRPGKSRRNKK